MKKKYADYISVREFANQGKMLNARKEPVTETYIYKIIREYQDGKRQSLPFDYIRVGQIIRIKQE